MKREMVRVSKCGLMAPSIKDSGFKVKLMGTANCSMQTEISMKGNGLMIKQTVKEYTHTHPERGTLVIGKMIDSMGMVKSRGQMDPSI